jgi:hypothetical protein
MEKVRERIGHVAVGVGIVMFAVIAIFLGIVAAVP